MNTTQQQQQRKPRKKKLKTIQDILDIFLILPPQSFPMFVARDLSNLPPISVTNFDLSSLLKDMCTTKEQMEIMQEAQDITAAAHAAICTEAKHKQNIEPNKIVKRSPLTVASSA